MAISPVVHPPESGKGRKRMRKTKARIRPDTKEESFFFPEKEFSLLSYRSNLTRRFSLSNLFDGFFSKNRSPFE
ncbi:hypothetical protein CEXT_93811 [Caerostris extrusa]|uniref:Uncharacterized protein n=1 Tax=Caerostris extrusa TaxID=172846 RepID=A0AAV4P5I6_CAEEX|nr:hypothetical protein CEXT_93811 [Caerostris extrusa]